MNQARIGTLLISIASFSTVLFAQSGASELAYARDHDSDGRCSGTHRPPLDRPESGSACS